MVSREMQKIDPAAVLSIAAEASATFDATLTPVERDVLEKLSVTDGDPGVVYSTLEREQALEDFELLAAADSLEILSGQIRAVVEQREQEIYRKCLDVYYAAEELAQDPANAHLIAVAEDLRRAHLRQYGKPIPPKAGK